jgi:rubrerythrin
MIAENYIQNEIIVFLLIGVSILILASYNIAKKAGMFSLYESSKNQRFLDNRIKRYYCPNCGRMWVSSRVPANCNRCNNEDLEISQIN